MSRSKKKRIIPREIIRLYQKLRNIRSVYLDTCIIGYSTDGIYHKDCGELISKYINKFDIECFISELVLDELSEINMELEDKRLHRMVRLWERSINTKFKSRLIKIKNVSDEEKEFVKFLTDLGISKNDAIHFTLTLFYNKDAFISFNKKIFLKHKNKINRKIMLIGKRIPEVFEAEELCSDLRKLERYKLI